ncbi:MAG TPA: response regulator [Trueperaceae bacterium]|nr:response regulator [Trueperaceae bacterium]
MTNGAVQVLLVEDNPNDVKLTLRALEKHRLANRIEVVRDGQAALDFLFGTGGGESPVTHNPAPRLILLDLKLPKFSGLEVLERIKADPRTRTIPVTILTSSREDIDIERAYQLGVNSYIVKPVDFTQFSEAVEQLGFYWLLLNELPTS